MTERMSCRGFFLGIEKKSRHWRAWRLLEVPETDQRDHGVTLGTADDADRSHDAAAGGVKG